MAGVIGKHDRMQTGAAVRHGGPILGLMLAVFAASGAATADEAGHRHDDPGAVYNAIVAAIRGEGDPAVLERHVDYTRLKRSLLETATQCGLAKDRQLDPDLDVSPGSRAHRINQATSAMLGPFVRPHSLRQLVDIVAKLLQERPQPAGAERVGKDRYEVRYRTQMAGWAVVLERNADGVWQVTEVGRRPPANPDRPCVTPDIVPNPLYAVRPGRG